MRIEESNNAIATEATEAECAQNDTTSSPFLLIARQCGWCILCWVCSCNTQYDQTMTQHEHWKSKMQRCFVIIFKATKQTGRCFPLNSFPVMDIDQGCVVYQL